MTLKLTPPEWMGLLGGGLATIATLNPVIGVAGLAGGAAIGFLYEKIAKPKTLTPVPTAGTGVVSPPPVVGTTLGNPSHNVPIWSNAIPLADVSNVAIPANFQGNSALTSAIQTALNSWAMSVNYPPLVSSPLAVSGTYDSATQNAVAQFQMYENSANTANLGIDGLAGTGTQPWLWDFGPAGPGTY